MIDDQFYKFFERTNIEMSLAEAHISFKDVIILKGLMARVT